MIIQGLRKEKWAAPTRGRGSYCADSPPFYMVFHGQEGFAHDHFGVHLGQEDHLTFLGANDKFFLGHFIDCRKDSPTHGVRETVELNCDPSVALIIPAGVGHAFAGIEGVFTLNNYVLYLPNPDELFDELTEWNIGHDVINLPLDCSGSDVPHFLTNSEQAGALLYEVLAAHHRVNLTGRDLAYPVVHNVPTSDKGGVKIKFLPKQNTTDIRKLERMWTSANIGAHHQLLRQHLRILSGDDSGILIIPSFSDLQILKAPFCSLRNFFLSGMSSLAVTFLSNEDIVLNLKKGDDAIDTICVPGNGLFEFILPPDIDVEMDDGIVFAIVRVEKAIDQINNI